MSKPARSRADNFKIEEDYALIEYASIFIQTIESKESSNNVLRQKDKDWDFITKQFNEQFPQCTERTKKGLKLHWGSLKGEAKKKCQEDYNFARGTGGGPATKKGTKDDILNKIAVLIPDQMVRPKPHFGSDVDVGRNSSTPFEDASSEVEDRRDDRSRLDSPEGPLTSDPYLFAGARYEENSDDGDQFRRDMQKFHDGREREIGDTPPPPLQKRMAIEHTAKTIAKINVETGLPEREADFVEGHGRRKRPSTISKAIEVAEEKVENMRAMKSFYEAQEKYYKEDLHSLVQVQIEAETARRDAYLEKKLYYEFKRLNDN